MNAFDDVLIENRGKKLINKWGEFGEMSAVKDELFLFVIEAHGAIEELSARIICKQVINEDYSERVFDYVYSDMSQHHREKFLKECGILNNDILGRLSEFRRLRNRIAHNRGKNLDWQEDNIPDKIRIAIRALLD